MKQYTLRIVGAVLLLLGAALAWLWFDANGALRNVRWQEPEPHQPDFSSMVAQLPSQEPTDLSRFVATLERPLFSPSRRPPPPPPPPTVAPPPPPPDPLANIHLFGVFAGAEGKGGIIARIDGKPKRVYTGQSIGAWTLKSIEGRNVALERGTEVRVLNLAHARVAAPVAPTVAAGNPEAATPPTTPTAEAAAAPRQALSDFVRNRTALRNAARAKAGLPPLP